MNKERLLMLMSGVKPTLTPSQITNLKLWLDFSDTTTMFTDAGTTAVTSDADKIYQINDKSGNNYHARQATEDNRPLYKVNVKNGKSAGYFDGTKSVLSLISGLGMFRNISAGSIVVVVKPEVVATSITVFHINKNDLIGLARANIGVGATANKAFTGGRREDVNSYQSVISTNDVLVNTFYALTGIFDFANSNLYIYINNILEGTKTDFQTDGNTSDTDSSYITVGSNTTTATSNFKGNILEIIVYSKLLQDYERTRLYNYIEKKWGF